MLLKILTCDCIINSLSENGIEFDIFRTFDTCECNSEHKIVVTTCKIHKLNVNGFVRNYFQSVICSCV